ncbi:MAG TPA: class 1 fructose-bisphosphatase [Anaerolineaceae bacterium]
MFEQRHDHGDIITIERHILEEQRNHPEATGILTSLLYDLALAGKYIASHTTRAGLAEILGATQETNVQGERVMKLDQLADRAIYRLNDHTGRLALMASEEHADPLPIPAQNLTGKYILLYDPLDGSSNIDYNATIGTIFAIFRRKTSTGEVTLADCLQPGRDLVVAGYLAYGVSTMLVYTSGSGAHGFTLDPAIGEFLLTHPNIRIPSPPRYYSVNEGNEIYWSDEVRAFTRRLKGLDGMRKPLSGRYVGSLVADFHRNLLAGGIFYYPPDRSDPSRPHGKLRLLYEAAPLAFIAHQAGGYASDGKQPILDIIPESLHQRTALYIGNRELVELAEEMTGGK